MEWCLDCHRNPERYVRPREAVFNIDYAAAGRPARARRAAGRGIQDPEAHRAARRATDERRLATTRASDLDAMRSRARRARSGREFWRSLDELADDAGVPASICTTSSRRRSTAIADPVAPAHVPEADGRVAGARRRRRACTRQPAENDRPLRPAARGDRPRQAALLRHRDAARRRRPPALLVESHEGRPTKIEGNPAPSRQPRRDRRLRAGVGPRPLRSRPLADAAPTSARSGRGRAFLGAIRAALDGAAAAQGRRPPHPDRVGHLADARPRRSARCSPRFPRRKWHQWEPVGRDNARAGAQLAFGEYVDAQYRFDQRRRHRRRSTPTSSAAGPGSLRYARDFAARPARPERAERDEPALRRRERRRRSTGARADHRLPLRPRDDRARSRAPLAARARRAGAAAGAGVAPAQRRTWIAAVAKDLQAHRGASARHRRRRAAAGRARARARDERRRSATSARRSSTPRRSRPSRSISSQSLRELVADMNAGTRRRAASSSAAIRSTPRPPTSTFAAALSKVPLRVHLGLYDDETSALCHWHVPEAHFLESVERRARATTARSSIVQPLIAPLYGGQSAHELLAALARSARALGATTSSASTGRRSAAATSDFERCLAALAARRRRRRTPRRRRSASRSAATTGSSRHAGSRRRRRPSGLEIVFRPDPTRARRPLRQQRLAAGAAEAAHEADLGQRGARQPGDRRAAQGRRRAVVPGRRARADHQRRRRAALSTGRTVRGAVSAVARATPDDCVTVHLGYGRTRAGHVGNGAGFNAYALRTSDALWFGARRSRSRRPATRVLARLHAAPPADGRPRHRPRASRCDEYRRAIRNSVARGRRDAAEDADALSRTTSTTATRGAWRST